MQYVRKIVDQGLPPALLETLGPLFEFDASCTNSSRARAKRLQREMAERNTDVPPDRRIEFRMGINVGDIIRDRRDIYGDA